MRSVTATLKRTVIFIHRWLGVALCLLFFVWFVSGIAMMYWDYPRVGPKDRLAHLSALDTSHVRLSLADAYGRLAAKRPPDQMALSTHDGRPAYRFRIGRRQTLVYADDGSLITSFTVAEARRTAEQWTGSSTRAATMDTITAEDQWTVAGEFRGLRPLYKFSWPGGEEIYVSSVSGEVVQYTTRASRTGAYFGAIPHWLYFTPLRKDGALWNKVVIWTSGVATVGAFLGLVIGVWMYSPSKKYRHDGGPSGIPYHGQKRLHTIFGLFFGLLACTWAFSGLLSMDPFPLGGSEFKTAGKIQAALRGGRPNLVSLSAIAPANILAKLPQDFGGRELEFSAFAGKPVYVVRNATDLRIITADAEVLTEFNPESILGLVRAAVKPDQVSESRAVNEYEAYYVDRQHQHPLPALFVQLNDRERSMYYIDPKTARIVETYDSGARVNRWLYQGLHSLDLPWLYRHRPVWDILMLFLLLGGTTLCVTAIILGWQVIARKLPQPGTRRIRGAT